MCSHTRLDAADRVVVARPTFQRSVARQRGLTVFAGPNEGPVAILKGLPEWGLDARGLEGSGGLELESFISTRQPLDLNEHDRSLAWCYHARAEGPEPETPCSTRGPRVGH